MLKIQKMLGVMFVLLVGLQSFTMKGDTAITFTDENIAKVLKKAEAEKKVVFVYVSIKGCHTCHDLEKTMKDHVVGEFFNKNFINVHLDGDKTGNNIRAAKWGVAQVPAMVFLSDKNTVLHKIEGFQSPDDLIAHGKTALEKLNK